jgi:hypothetical protein
MHRAHHTGIKAAQDVLHQNRVLTLSFKPINTKHYKDANNPKRISVQKISFCFY